MRTARLATLLGTASVLVSAALALAQDAPPSPPKTDGGATVLVISAGTAHESKEPIKDLEYEVVGPDWKSIRVRADGNGRATLEVRPGARYTVIGRAPGFIRGHDLTEVLAAGTRTSAYVLLWNAQPIEGSVRSAVDGKPVVGAKVRVFDEPFFVHPWCGTGAIWDPVPPVEELVTDAEGKFTAHRTIMDLGGMDLGRLAVLVEAPGFRLATAECTAPDDPKGKPLDIRMLAGATLRGTVRSPDGKPVAGARVLSLCRGDFGLDSSEPLKGVDRNTLELPEGWYVTSEVVWKALRGRTGPDGTFTLAGLEPGKSYHAYAVAEGWACSPMATDILAPEAGKTTGRDFLLRAPGKVRVALNGTDGAPPAGAELTLQSQGAIEEDSPIAAGAPTFDDLEPGDYSLEIECPGTAARVETFTLKEGEDREVLADLASGAAIVGVVVDDAGTPVPGAEIEVRVKGGPMSFRSESGVTTDAEGRFRVPGLKPGTYELSAGKVKVGTSDAASFTAPAEGVRLVMPRFGSFRLALLREEGDEGPTKLEWYAEFKSFGHENSLQAVGRRIDFHEYECVEPGELAICFRVEGYAPVFRIIRVAAAGVTDLADIPLSKGSRLQGQVMDDEGKPVRRAEVRAEFPGWRRGAVARAWTDAEGRFVLEQLPSGELTMKVAAGEPDEVICFEEKVVVGPDPLPEATWVTYLPAHLAVIVQDPEGHPLRGVRVRATDLGRTPETCVQPRDPTDADGCLGMELRPGRYRMSLLVGGEWVPLQEIAVAKGEVTEVNLVLIPQKKGADDHQR